MIDIDGSYFEGGGQIVRTACALSAALRTPCHVYNIRRGRPKPGLRSQHLAGIEALSRFCRGTLRGGSVGSTEIVFLPGTSHKEVLEAEIRTAGSITLVLQTLSLPALLAPRPLTITIRGGATDTYLAPTMDYFMEVFLRVLGTGGVRIEPFVEKRGYYPKGGAEVSIKVAPSRITPVTLLERGVLDGVFIFSRASEFLKGRNVAQRQAEGARKPLKSLGVPLTEQVRYHDTLSPGSSICLAARYENTVIGADNLGKRGKEAEAVGEEAALELLKEMQSGACLDRHLADQVLPFLAFGENGSAFTTSEITNHCRTNMWVIEQFVQGSFSASDNRVAWTPR